MGNENMTPIVPDIEHRRHDDDGSMPMIVTVDAGHVVWHGACGPDDLERQIPSYHPDSISFARMIVRSEREIADLRRQLAEMTQRAEAAVAERDALMQMKWREDTEPRMALQYALDKTREEANAG